MTVARGKDGMQEARGRRQEAGGRRQETGDRRQGGLMLVIILSRLKLLLPGIQ